MATLAHAGRITEDNVIEEVTRLGETWSDDETADAVADVLGEQAAALDLFDRCQLSAVIAVCRQAASLSEAGRKLFAVSRAGKKQANDADRLRKYLARFGLDFEAISAVG
jgi:transcriptional regulatory protein RtcR